MATANFHLKKDVKSDQALIVLQMKYSGQRLVFSTGEKINVKNWNANKQRVKNNTQTTSDGTHSLNDLLHELEGLAESTYKQLLKNGIPAPEKIKQVLRDFMNQNKEGEKDNKSKPTLFSLIDRFISGEITAKGKQKSKHTLKTYKTVKTRLLDFQEKTKLPVNFDTIDLDFFYKYINHISKPSKYIIKEGTKKGNVIQLKPSLKIQEQNKFRLLKHLWVRR
jgi:hypothetical protein